MQQVLNGESFQEPNPDFVLKNVEEHITPAAPVKVIDMYYSSFPLKNQGDVPHDHVEVLYIIEGDKPKVTGNLVETVPSMLDSHLQIF